MSLVFFCFLELLCQRFFLSEFSDLFSEFRFINREKRIAGDVVLIKEQENMFVKVAFF